MFIQNNQYLIKIFILIILSIGTLFFLGSAFYYLFYPYDIYLDSYVVFNTLQVIRGEPLYRYSCQPPHYFNIYPPLFYILSYTLAKIFNISSFGYLTILLRLTVIILTFSCSLVIFLICKRLRYSNLTSLIAVLFFLGHPLLFCWGFVARVDMLAVLLSLLSLYTFLFKNKFYPYLSILFAILALYTKQTQVAIFFAIFIYLILQREYSMAIKFLSLYVTGVALLFFLLNYLTYGAAYFNIFTINTYIKFNFNIHESIIIDLFKLSLFYIFILFLLISARKSISLLIRLFFIFSFSIALFLSFRSGAGANYFLESLALLAIIAASLINNLLLEKKKIFLILVVPFLVFTYLRYGLAWIRGSLYTGLEQEAKYKDQIIEMIKSKEGDIFFGLSPDVVIKADRYLLCNACTYFISFCKNSFYDKFLLKLKNKEFVFFIIPKDSFDWYIKNLGEIFYKNYVLEKTIGNYYIYIPQ